LNSVPKLDRGLGQLPLGHVAIAGRQETFGLSVGVLVTTRAQENRTDNRCKTKEDALHYPPLSKDATGR
jgi:hypothetical protein